MIVGGGPAGLECARALGQRGYEVILAEARREFGGRVSTECRLPGLSEWARVRDYRLQQIERLPNIEMYPESELQAEDVLAVQADHVVIATGATWNRDGVGHFHLRGIEELGPSDRIFTPDDVMAGRVPEGRIILFDDDHYYMGAVLSERIHDNTTPVTLVTPEDKVAAWAKYTAEQTRTQKRLLEIGVEIITGHGLLTFNGHEAVLSCVYTGRSRRIEADSIVIVTARRPKDSLYHAVCERLANGAEGAPKSVRRIGDCEAPAIIAAAVFAGHRYARELDSLDENNIAAKRDRFGEAAEHVA